MQVAPLPERLRPKSFDELICSHPSLTHLFKQLQPFLTLEAPSPGRRPRVPPLSSMIIHGPPGTGKSTIMSLIRTVATRSGAYAQVSCEQCSSVSINVVRDFVTSATKQFDLTGMSSVLLLDEVHRLSRVCQDALLDPLERGLVILISVTTETPTYYIQQALFSRCRFYALTAPTPEEICSVVLRAISDRERGLNQTAPFAQRHVPIEITRRAAAALCWHRAGDVRGALSALERAFTYALSEYQESQFEKMNSHLNDLPDSQDDQDALSSAASDVAAPSGPATVIVIRERHAALAVQELPPRGDRAGDDQYMLMSAFIKSMRGSDPDATVYYLARLLDAGPGGGQASAEEAKVVARRIVIAASEEVGLADDQCLPIAVAALKALEAVGMPEARITLAHAALRVALAPKSPSAYQSIGSAMEFVASAPPYRPPEHIINPDNVTNRAHGAGVEYRYPHAHGGWVPQRYLPLQVNKRFYPGESSVFLPPVAPAVAFGGAAPEDGARNEGVDEVMVRGYGAAEEHTHPKEPSSLIMRSPASPGKLTPRSLPGSARDSDTGEVFSRSFNYE